VSFLVKKVRNDLPGLAIAQRQGDWTVVIIEPLLVGIASIDDVLGVDVAYNVLGVVSDNALCAAIPEADPLFLVHDVDSDRQLLEHDADEARIVE
jgi:hypothetical protein